MVTAPASIDSRYGLLQRLQDARLRTDDLFAIVRPDSLYERPIGERHRIIFYIGHLEAFDWNLLRDRLIPQGAFHPEFDRLFAFGIDPVGGGLPQDQPSDWPSIAEVRQYVAQVRTRIDDGTQEVLNAGHVGREFSPQLLLNVAIEHRLMHAETLAYMLHQLPINRKIPQPQMLEPLSLPVMPATIEIPAGPVTLGLMRSDETNFGWDNEYEQHTVDVPAFAIDKYKITNGQYLQFIEDGGYEDRALWTDADWQWRTEHNISHPVFWNRAGDGWLYRGMFDEIPLPMDWPVYVSHAEANAYARWARKSLPSEAQWQRAAYGSPDDVAAPSPEKAQAGNFDFRRWDPTSVAASPKSISPFGAIEMSGNGWEWTSTIFSPFAGFEPFSFYPGYSANFFDGKHYVMKGGSARTAACLMRPSFRNWFQAHYQYVYCGFRCVSK